MSFVIAIYTREGLVMAADSRLTLTRRDGTPDGKEILTQVPASDANSKLFCTPSGIGISTFGDASVEREPLAGHIQTFISERTSEADTVEDVAKGICDYFNEFKNPPVTGFHVCGYTRKDDKVVAEVWRCNVVGSTRNMVNQKGQNGAMWDGENGLMSRIFTEVFIKSNDDSFASMGIPQVTWDFMTLQDAIDFAFFATRSTIDFIRFQPVAQTVGGPIDILAIKPNSFEWVARKSLRNPEHRHPN